MVYRQVTGSKRTIQLEIDPQALRFGELEINKNCNLNCAMCNTRQSTRPNSYMDPALFEKCLQYAKKLGQKKLALHTIGEPLLHPDLETYLRLLRKYGMQIGLSTNGLLLHRRIDLLVRYKDVIGTIRFSIDGASKEVYEKIRTPGKFDRLVDNLDLFRKTNAEGMPFPNVAMNSIVSTDNQHEIGYHVEFYSRYVPIQNIHLTLVNGLSPDNAYFFSHSILKNHIVPNRPCNQLNNVLHVLLDGRVSACCRDYNGELIFGSLQDNRPEELINNEAIRELRRMHMEDDIPADLFCADCYEIDPMVTRLFKFFTEALAYHYGGDWKAEEMQQKYDRFFDLFATGIPGEDGFVSLVF